jgi:hypothetical protein
MSEPEPDLPFVDAPHAPTVFVGECAGVFTFLGNVVLTFTTPAPDYSEPGKNVINRVVNVRLAMPVATAQNLALSLYDFLKQHGLDPADTIQTAGDPSRPQ